MTRINITDIPVLVLNYNRPEFTKRLVKNLEKIKPTNLYVSIDGHKLSTYEDRLKVDEVEKCFKNLGWKCNLKLVRNEKNYGLRNAVKKALDWFFEENEFGVILEDDIQFDINFFKYCQEFSTINLDPRIAAISGNNLLEHVFSPECFERKYLLAKIFHCWGWATWREKWALYDDNIENDENFFENSLPKFLKYDEELIKFWRYQRKRLKDNEIDSWAFRFHFSCLRKQLLYLTPPRNLTSNYGIGPGVGVNSNHQVPFFMESIKINPYEKFDGSYSIEESPLFEKFEEKFILGINRLPLIL